MMNKEFLSLLYKRYSPYINNVINSNIKFYRTNKTIKWRFGYNERVELFAWCDKKTNTITVNIKAVDFSFRQNEPLNIEYFLLHEIRHIYQHFEIKDYRTDPSKCNNVELAKKWAEEDINYVTALDKDGNENVEYFAQDMELDAFAYSYAVMKFKYGEVEYLYIPKAYRNEEFDKIVAKWQETFKDENL